MEAGGNKGSGRTEARKKGVLRARAWSHLQGGGVVVMVALQPRLLPVYNSKIGFFQANNYSLKCKRIPYTAARLADPKSVGYGFICRI
jgi:hypothetical protein